MNTPWLVILCKFSDSDEEPHPKQYYWDLFTGDDVGSSWNMVRYFDDYSQGTVGVAGSKVFGWYKLQKAVDQYNALGQCARGHLIQWAQQAAQAQDGVNPDDFFSTVVCTNLWTDIGAWFGPVSIAEFNCDPSLVAAGVVAQGVTGPRPWGLAEEMGHIYGLMHSRVDGSETDYLDPWDGMSAFSNLHTPDPEFSELGPGLNAWNMQSQNWLDQSRVWKDSANNFDETITLRPHVRRDLPGNLAAEMSGGFLVEFRVPEGWDGGIPRAAVLVHRFENGHSYLMAGNSGSHDLVVGDSFGDQDPGNSPLSPFADFNRLDVLSIDPAAEEATIRLRHHSAFLPGIDGRAIDPMYLILSGSAYGRWVEGHHPHVEVTALRAFLEEMPPREQEAALARARALVHYGHAVERAAKSLQGEEVGA